MEKDCSLAVELATTLASNLMLVAIGAIAIVISAILVNRQKLRYLNLLFGSVAAFHFSAVCGFFIQHLLTKEAMKNLGQCPFDSVKYSTVLDYSFVQYALLLLAGVLLTIFLVANRDLTSSRN